MPKAFLYDNKYYLFPESCQDTESLKRAHGDRPAAYTLLEETMCQPPYFVRDYAREVELTIPADARLYPCEVELMSMKEYNNRLRTLVVDYCQGCPSFGAVDETDESLEGHHGEISLNGTCFFRASACAPEDRERDYCSPKLWMETFITRFGEIREDLEKAVDRDDMEAAWKLMAGQVAQIVAYPVPPMFFRRLGDRYQVCFTTYFETLDRTFFRMLFRRLEKAYGDRWSFLSYIPQGFYVPPAQEPKGASFEFRMDVTDYLAIRTFGEAQASSAYYLWLCGLLGENRLQWSCQDYASTALEEGETLPEDCVSWQALSDAVDTLLAPMDPEDLERPVLRLVPLYPQIPEDCPNPEEEFDRRGILCNTSSTTFLDRFHLPVHFGQKPANVWEGESAFQDCSVPLARLVFTDVPARGLQDFNDPELQQKVHTVIGDLNTWLSDESLFSTLSVIMRAGTMEYCGMVYDMPRFQFALRRLAPLFQRVPAELYLYTASNRSGGRYRLDWKMDCLNTEVEHRSSLADSES